MSGHSKWATIKRAKGATDAKRGSLFTKLSNAISIAVREGGGGEPNFNFKLRLAVDKAKEANMPKDNIARAIDKGMGKGEGAAALQTAIFEGFGTHGVAVIVEAITDNTNRTGGELRNYFAKNGGNLGGPGSVAYLFKKVGCLSILRNLSDFPPKADQPRAESLDTVLEKALEAEAEDVEESEEEFLVYTRVEDLHKVKERLMNSGLTVSDAGIVYRPNKDTLASVAQERQQLVGDFIEGIEEMDDIQNVYTNAN